MVIDGTDIGRYSKDETITDFTQYSYLIHGDEHINNFTLIHRQQGFSGMTRLLRVVKSDQIFVHIRNDLYNVCK